MELRFFDRSRSKFALTFNRLIFGLFILRVSTLNFSTSAFAKVGDPAPELFGKWVFTSHSHQVRTYEQKPGEGPGYCISHTCKDVWSTEIPLPEYRDQFTPPNPTLEKDVQWCRIERLEMKDGLLRVSGCDHRVFLLSPSTGEIVSH